MNKFSISLLICISCLLIVSSFAYTANNGDFKSFLEFVKKYDRKYETIEEFNQRFLIFQQNSVRVAKLRLAHFDATGEPGDFIYGVTKFSDISQEEFKSRYLSFKPSPQVFAAHEAQLSQPSASASASGSAPSGPIPKQFDWRDHGAVTPVKDQAQCGSCWAFSAVEEVESAWFLANHSLPTLSPQQVVSCDTTDGGCNGGDTVSAYAYIKQAGGLESEDDYPYTSQDGDSGTCDFNKKDIVAKIKGFTYATPPCSDACTKQNETALAESLTNIAPVSICVYAETWQFYTSGILKSSCPKAYSELDHCVQLVGYDASGATPYWIIRNSWSTDWGVDGYIWVEYGQNLCGVADEATLLTI